MKNIRTYHYQASEDKYAKRDDREQSIKTTTMKQINESYKEFLRELMLESQEAY